METTGVEFAMTERRYCRFSPSRIAYSEINEGNEITGVCLAMLGRRYCRVLLQRWVLAKVVMMGWDIPVFFPLTVILIKVHRTVTAMDAGHARPLVSIWSFWDEDTRVFSPSLVS